MYKFQHIVIENLSKHQFVDGDIHYTWKDVDFLYKHKKTNRKLVVFFHGALNDTNISAYTFRGYDYEFPNTDILSLSNLLIKKYHKTKKILLSWYLSTKDHNHLPLYTGIFDKILKKKYDKVLFTGTSGGGYPAIFFSSLYHSECLISNSQIYLNKYNYFAKLLAHLKITESDLDIDIEKHIMKRGPPKKIYLYTNQRDVNHYENHTLPFIVFLKKNSYDSNIEVNIFIGDEPKPNQTHHTVQFPNKQKHMDIIKKHITKIK